MGGRRSMSRVGHVMILASVLACAGSAWLACRSYTVAEQYWYYWRTVELSGPLPWTTEYAHAFTSSGGVELRVGRSVLADTAAQTLFIDHGVGGESQPGLRKTTMLYPPRYPRLGTPPLLSWNGFAAGASELRQGRSAFQDWGLVFPFWFASLALGSPALVLASFRLFTLVRTRMRSKRGVCRGCGYDLRANPGRCPECGTEPAAPAPTGPTPTSSVESSPSNSTPSEERLGPPDPAPGATAADRSDPSPPARAA